jgi:amidase
VNLDDYVNCDATELRRLLDQRAVSPDEVLDAARSAIAAVNGDLNATSQGPFDDVPEAAVGPFAGVPIAVKDTLFEAGRPQTLGSRLVDGLISPFDSTVATRLRDAGFRTVARTATPELGFNIDTAPVTNGQTRNPWNLDRSPGGSSGGSAALVAARAVPIAHGNDGGGSIRIPAAWCGLVGLKPTRGRVPVGPHLGEFAGGQAHEFALTRTVRDAAALLDILAGPAAGDPYCVARPAHPFTDVLDDAPRSLRIAIHTGSYWGAPTAPAIRSAVERVALTLEDMGHHVEPAVATVDATSLRDAHIALWTSTLAGIALKFSTLLQRPIDESTLEAATLACVDAGRAVLATDLGSANATFNDLNRTWGSFLDDYDLFLSPTTPTGPPPAGEPDQNDPRYCTARGWIDDVFDRIAFAPIANVTGQPSISLPLGRDSEGMPIGVMLTAQSLRDDLLLQVARQLEVACPWIARRPPSPTT